MHANPISTLSAYQSEEHGKWGPEERQALRPNSLTAGRLNVWAQPSYFSVLCTSKVLTRPKALPDSIRESITGVPMPLVFWAQVSAPGWPCCTPPHHLTERVSHLCTHDTQLHIHHSTFNFPPEQKPYLIWFLIYAVSKILVHSSPVLLGIKDLHDIRYE
jgi:hypothetical protein